MAKPRIGFLGMGAMGGAMARRLVSLGFDVTGYDVRVIHATTGEIIRALTIDPDRRYHGTGNPRNPPGRTRKSKRPEP